MKSLSLLCVLLLCTPAWAAPHLLPQSSEALDQQLAATLQSLSDGKIPEARVLARQAARQFPRSALAQLLSAELGASAAHRQILAGGDATEQGQRLRGLLQEARARLHDRPSPASNPSPDRLPGEVVQLGKAVSALLVVDLADSSMHHLAVNAGEATLIQQWKGRLRQARGRRQQDTVGTLPDRWLPFRCLLAGSVWGRRTDAELPECAGSISGQNRLRNLAAWGAS